MILIGRVPVAGRCEVDLGGEREWKKWKNLSIWGLLCRRGEIDGEIRERALKGRSVKGSLARVMKGRNPSMEVKRGLGSSILLPTLTYGSETWTWNRAQQSRVHAVEMSYLRGACGVTRWEGESNNSVCERCNMRAGEVWSGGMGKKKYTEVVWPY